MSKATIAFSAASFLCAAAMAGQPDPYAKANRAWISIDGTVESVARDSFMLDYGPGTIKVEMDDSDRHAEGYLLKKGDEVRVSGRIDDDFFQQDTIEAGNVFVENLGAYFYASPADEEDLDATFVHPLGVSSSILRGTLQAVGDDQFTISSPGGSIEVNVDSMPYDPLDEDGYQKVREGDYVTVQGNMDTEFWDLSRELNASSVVIVRKQQQDAAGNEAGTG